MRIRVRLPRLAAILSVVFGSVVAAGGASAQKIYDSGANDTEIKIGNIMPYSGPASAYSTIGRVEAAYFNKINAEGGINGRKIDFISYDDAYSPPKTFEQVRRLVEDDEVLLVFSPLGTAQNTAIRQYLNARKIPQLFVATAATKWNDPKNFPWTMGWQPSYQGEARAYAHSILRDHPNARIAVLYQNDDYGRDYLKGLRDGLGDKVTMIVAEDSYDVSEPTIESHIVKLQASGADVFVDIATPKFAAQAIRKAGEIGWTPVHYLNSVSAYIGSVLKPAGFDHAQGVISTAYLKDQADPQWTDDPGMKAYFAFLDKYDPDANRSDLSTVYGYTVAQALVQVLRQCGDDLTRTNVMRQAANLRDFRVGTMLPGIKANTGPTDFAPLEQLQLERFEGRTWHRFGDLINTGIDN